MFKKSVNIESAFRPLNVVSKIVGLAHFSGHRNSFTGKIKREENRESKFVNIIWCIVVICAIVTGFVYSVLALSFFSYYNVFSVVVFIISMPIAYLGTLLALIAGLTWNRKKFPELVLKMSLFDEHMFGANRADVYKKQYKYCIIQLMGIILILFPFCCYNVYFFGADNNYMDIHLHVTQFIRVVVILQFINVVWMITERLEYLKKELASCLELRAELGSKFSMNAVATSKSKNESTLQISFLEAGNKGTGVLVSDFPVFTRRRPPFSEVERLIRVRKLYNMLFRMSKLISGMYGIHIISDLMYCFINFVVCIYGMIGVTTGSMGLIPTMSFIQHIVLYMYSIVVSLLRVTVISVSCHKASAQVAEFYQEIQQLLITHALRQDTRRHLKLLLQQVSSTRALFTACDVFTVDLSVLFTFVTSAATYVIVLVQLK